MKGAMKMGDACPCCGGKMDTEAKVESAAGYEAEEEDKDEASLEIEGTPESIRATLDSLIPKG
jgi:DNA repair exonuclease SbcCD ATPase subunit